MVCQSEMITREYVNKYIVKNKIIATRIYWILRTVLHTLNI